MADVINQTAAEGDIIVEQGATFDIELEWIDENKNLIDMTGWTAALQVRAFPKSTELLFEMTTENGRIDLSAPGRIRLFIDKDTTAAMTFSDGKYNLELYPPSSTTIRLLKGRFIVDSEVVI